MRKLLVVAIVVVVVAAALLVAGAVASASGHGFRLRELDPLHIIHFLRKG